MAWGAGCNPSGLSHNASVSEPGSQVACGSKNPDRPRVIWPPAKWNAWPTCPGARRSTPGRAGPVEFYAVLPAEGEPAPIVADRRADFCRHDLNFGQCRGQEVNCGLV